MHHFKKILGLVIFALIFAFPPSVVATVYTGPTGIIFSDFDEVGLPSTGFKDILVDCSVNNGRDVNINSLKDGSILGGGHGCDDRYDNFWMQDNMVVNGVSTDEQIADGHYCIFINGVGAPVCTHGEFDILDGLLVPQNPEPCTENCFSNVLFLPGIKGSVLKTESDTLWPPTALSDDVGELALTVGGESVNEIFTDEILNEFYGTEIYGPFSQFMDGLVADETIQEWQPLAYDWRFSPERVVEDGIKTSNGTIDVMERIETLAESSRTGKVTIVAHSMGGLLGKAVIKKLEDEGKENLIDSFIMVGTPQLGTPQAVGAILHGDGESIAAGFITSAVTIRSVAQNMPSAYVLLPSPKYFDEVEDPLIVFDPEASFMDGWRSMWGNFINTYSGFASFTTGGSGTRENPDENVLRMPEVLQPEMIDDANQFHNEYDNYQFPEHIRVVQVAGWGSPTVKAIEYKMNHGLSGYEVLFTREGDRTVVYPSAISSGTDEKYFFNIFDFNDVSEIDIQHRNLLNANTIQNLIKLMVKKESIVEEIFLSNAKPSLDDLEDQLLVSSYSPIIMGAYDQPGNFTGIDLNQDLSADILSITEDIPGSTFLYTSESQHIFLPKEGVYEFIYKGTDEGPTTLTIENFTADVALPVASYTDMPTTSDTVANFTVQSSAPEDTEIELDVNGDGDIETIQADNVELSLNELLELIKEKISALVIKEKPKQDLLKRIASLEKRIEHKKQKNLKILAELGNKITQEEIRGRINTADAVQIMDLLNLLELQAVEQVIDPIVITELRSSIKALNIGQNLKDDLMKRVERLEQKQVLIKTLQNLSMDIMNRTDKGRITNTDAQEIINLLKQIESMI